MTHLKVYWKQLGGHIHCRVFSGKSQHVTHGKNGDLIFDLTEWRDGVALALYRIADVAPEEE